MTDIKLNGGQLSLQQLNAIFKTIPVEFDFIDENDIVRWSSANDHRLFKRTDSDLGKHVLEVHPGHSQSHVKQVLHDMHSGERDSISIMIKYHDRPVNIAFYALRDKDNNYLGCVEVTQDVSSHQQKGSLWRNIKQVLHKSK
ncbi:PAS domain-containing protein [Limosilactobacillus sp. STM2_1]|uniref:PAS domain-containing protein n=1 Tax=Limosilactobacillus rudii TaxID=2759755 RepID=A0A7W3UMM7_9LACO|nr:PAS domain-containing protein [Limosilactobacillus rudii]MBB1080323.1 PAS domain-containing protein [Limosilactobacillus rudii]MBB1098349.1 PAS domain-containing protein [Limosilactobacillus rudii]MCD7135357.1 PAS domain-containing protein [Limosilactobacillus rudii]